jgi:hypothetical protein
VAHESATPWTQQLGDKQVDQSRDVSLRQTRVKSRLGFFTLLLRVLE